MYSLITECINQIQISQTVGNQINRSNDQTVTLNTKNTNVPTLSRRPLTPLNFVDTCSLSNTNINPIQTNTKLPLIKRHCKSMSNVIATTKCT